MRALPFILAAIVASGCAAPLAEPDAQPEMRFGYGCLSGALEESAPGVCVARIREPDVQLSEPSLALHPDRADVIAVAAHAIGGTALMPSGSAVSGRVYVTEDGGGSWRSSTLPFPEGTAPGSFYSDPSVAFDAGGRLHASGMVLHPAASPGIFATWSDDLGRTWAPGTLLASEGRNDRQWTSVGPDGVVYVSWQEAFTTSRVAWSLDGGSTWRAIKDAPPGCTTASPVAFVAGEAWVACYDAERGSNLVFRLDLDAAALDQIGEIVGMNGNGPRILELDDGSVVVMTYSGLFARSVDGGRSWTSPLYVFDLLQVDDTWASRQVYWSVVDEAGLLHLQVARFHRDDPGEHLTQERPHDVAHAVIDAVRLRVHHEARLTPETAERDANPPASLVTSIGDDWNGIEFAHGHGIAVWMNGGALELTRIERAS